MSGSKSADSDTKKTQMPQTDANQEQPEITEGKTENLEAESAEQPPADWFKQQAEAEEKIAHYHDELLRARAEVENIRRRSQEEVSKARKFGIESFAESLVPVIDSLEAALDQPDQSAQSWQEGVETTLKQLLSAFERNSLKAVAPQPGDSFDPHVHQAISQVPSEQPQGTVAQLLQKGYTISDRVLRPALVMVSSGQ